VLEQQVRAERTGWRDLALSERHRRWGMDCPMVDVDFLAVEYDRGLPKAIVEYKEAHAQKQWSLHPSFKALQILGTRANLPVFAVRYASDFSCFRVTALNAAAKAHVPRATDFSEYGYVALLYRVRGRAMPDGLPLQTAEPVG